MQQEEEPLLGGRYRFESEIGRGRVGTVFAADDLTLERKVAVKVLHPAIASDPASAEAFVQQASQIRALDHPNVLPVHLVGQDHSGCWIAMALTDGQPLTKFMASRRGQPLFFDSAGPMVAGILDGLAYAHSKGVVHGALRPSNVLLTKKLSPQIADLGIEAKLHPERVELAGGGPRDANYLAPEQQGSGAPTPASDLFAAGMILYQLVTGALPFDDEDPELVAHRVKTEEAPPASARVPDAPPGLDAFLQRALAKDPAQRFSSAVEMKAALEAVGRGEVPAATPAPTPPASGAEPLTMGGGPVTSAGPPPDAAGGVMRGALLALVALALVAGGGLVVLWPHLQQRLAGDDPPASTAVASAPAPTSGGPAGSPGASDPGGDDFGDTSFDDDPGAGGFDGGAASGGEDLGGESGGDFGGGFDDAGAADPGGGFDESTFDEDGFDDDAGATPFGEEEAAPLSVAADARLAQLDEALEVGATGLGKHLKASHGSLAGADTEAYARGVTDRASRMLLARKAVQARELADFAARVDGAHQARAWAILGSARVAGEDQKGGAWAYRRALEVADLAARFHPDQSAGALRKRFAASAGTDPQAAKALVWMNEADELLAKGALNDAKGRLAQVVKAFPEARAALSRYFSSFGARALRGGSVRVVRPILKVALDFDKGNVEAHATMGEYYLTKVKDFGRALFHYRVALKRGRLLPKGS